MDDSARGIATASLTLQSSLLQALVRKGVLTPADALDIVDNSLRSAANQPDAEPLWRQPRSLGYASRAFAKRWRKWRANRDCQIQVAN